jgi:crotonobetainyl-CoA:carnitine CoA-transferase CaiB-like acyl-CoA transferase
MGTHMAGGAFSNQPVPPMPERVGGWGVYQIFTSSDGKEIFIAATSDNLWQRLCAAFERPDLATDQRLVHNTDRVAAKAWLTPALIETFGRFTGAEIERRCSDASIPFAPIGNVETLFDDPQLNAGGLVETALANGVMTKLPKLPIEMDGRRPELRQQPPTIGEHSDDVLREVGFDDAAIAAFRKDGVIV